MGIVKSNRLIAEFMGLEEDSELKGFYLIDGTYYNLRYHFSWDWIMDVVCKINSFGTELWERNNVDRHNLTEALDSTDLSRVYELCITFIKWYNEKRICNT